MTILHINHYVSVVVDGQLDNWVGRNPEKYPLDRSRAVERARRLREAHRCAYAVEVKEIYDPLRMAPYTTEEHES